jgi:RNA polymerase sigma-70 factor (ECF subfamily)
MPPPDAPSARFIADITACQRHLHAFLSSVLWNIADADEVLQETNLALWRKADDYDPARPFLPWAMRFAQIQLKVWLKQKKRVPLPFDDAVIERLATQAADDSPALDAIRRALADCVHKLPADQRDLVMSRYGPGARVNAIAAARNVTPSALSEALRRIRMKLLACIDQSVANGGYS